MKLRRFNRILRQVSILPVVILGVTSCVLYLQIVNANRTVALIQRSDERIAQANLAAKLIVDEETSLRGYQITGDPRFLEPYVQAQQPLAMALQLLDSVPGNLGPDGVPVHGIEDLKAAHRLWIQSFAEPMMAELRSGRRANDPRRDLLGKQMMDRVRVELAGVVERTERRRAARIESWQRQVRWTEFALFGLAIVAGALIGMFMRNRMHWVTATYRASLADLEHRAAEIFLSEERLRTTITSIGDGVITCNPEGCVEMMNPAAEDLTGWTQVEAHAQPLDRVFHIVSETTRAIAENPVEKVRRLNRVIGLANHTVLIRRDGTEMQIADSGAPIRDKDGQILGFVMVFRDVTNERRTQDALIAQEKLAVAGRLAATIAHEINNPLSSVLDMLYLMRNGVDESESRRYMEIAEAELTRVGQIVRAMLGLYRESKSPIKIDLGETMREMLLLVERRFSDMGVHVEAKLDREICVMGFPAELRQVFTNLIMNAAEAAGDGGRVWVSVFHEDPLAAQRGGTRNAVVLIRDDGAGIEEQVLPQLFKPFFTTKGERGTGLGLWVSQGIVAKRNGTIDLTSSTAPEDHGTAAKVSLPVAGPLLRASRA